MTGLGTFTCARCGETYEKERPDEEALAEMVDRHGEAALNVELAVLCDDCFQELEKWRTSLPAEVQDQQAAEIEDEARRNR